ncbi:MAG: hypothetical protein K8I02_08595, partial [Candidatus Methylomirabilis sp.]|nr:hypothetical protein [Deltaproteobacteria bacterium]
MPVIDLDFYDRVVLDSRALGQQAVARFVLWPNYRLFQRVKIVFEGFERAPPPGVTDVILAPNHTDRFNYWPLQWEMWRRRHPFTSVWVKGKYYRHPASATFFNLMGCIPLPSL